MAGISLSSLRSRAIILVLLAVVPVLALTFYSYLEQRAFTVREMQRDAFVAARNMAHIQGAMIRNAQQFLAILAQLPQVRQRDPKACAELFANLMRDQESYAVLLAAKPDGEVFASFPPTTAPKKVIDRSWFQRATTYRAFVMGETQLGRISGKFCIPFGYPVLDDSGELTAVLSIGINLEWLGAFLAQSDLLGAVVAQTDSPVKSSLVLADDSGRLLFHYPDPGYYVGQVFQEYAGIKALTSKDEGVADIHWLDGKQRLFGFTRMPPPFRELYVAVGIPKEEVFLRVNRDLWRNLIWLSLVAALAMAAAWYGGDVFIRWEVNKLLAATRRLTGGDLAARTEQPYRSGELGQLAQAFDQMADSLQGRDGDLKKTAAELRQRLRDLNHRSLELAAANKELGDFAYTVAHDLRAPLRALGGFARILLEDYPEKLDENGQRYLNIIHQNAQKMGQLIDDLLSLARLGRREMSLVPINMTELATAVCKELQDSNPQRDLRIDIQSLPEALGDRAMLRQVLANLLLNAVKFTRDRDTALIQVSGWSDEPDNIYCVRDNGAGFDMKYVNKLFGVFQRLHTEKEFEGTGVGLATSKRIIERHGGRMWAESVLHEGASFYFSIPKKAVA